MNNNHILQHNAQIRNNITKSFNQDSTHSLFQKSEEVEDLEKAKSDDKFAKVMGEFKAGTLHSSDGSLVTKRSQAIAIAASESGRALEKAEEVDEEAEETDLEKGIVDDLSYQSKEANFITVSGKDMKAKLEAVKTRNTAELTTIGAKQAALVTQIGSEPDRESDNYQLERFKGMIANPKTYSYSYKKDVVSDGPYLLQSESNEPQVDIDELKSQYRDLVYKQINLQIENLQIDTFVRNTSDEKECNISLQVATALGF